MKSFNSAKPGLSMGAAPTLKGVFKMDSNRFIKLCELVGYDTPHLAARLNIDATEVEEFCRESKPTPNKLADELETFADWRCEPSHTETRGRRPRSI